MDGKKEEDIKKNELEIEINRKEECEGMTGEKRIKRPHSEGMRGTETKTRREEETERSNAKQN